MPSIMRKLLFFRNPLNNIFNRRKPEPEEITEEKWIADFGKPKLARFNSKSEPYYDTSLRKNPFKSGHSLVLALKKTGCIAWVEAEGPCYRDLVISGSVRIDPKGGYGAGGVLFRMMDEQTHYS
ncbi:MAG: hypothetical protein LBH43_05155, partial [Treponema sp.]|nr:hypothetical protein [Treponema sp.]